jgi:hypothetical protein
MVMMRSPVGLAVPRSLGAPDTVAGSRTARLPAIHLIIARQPMEHNQPMA